MYIKGITDYNREGEARETGLFAGPVSQDGELRATKNGKQYGTASVRAFNRQDGTAAFMTIKTFSETDAPRIAALRKGDRILCAGVVETREYNGKPYTDMLVDLLLTNSAPLAPACGEVSQRSVARRLPTETAALGFGGDPNDVFHDLGEEDGELPF